MYQGKIEAQPFDLFDVYHENASLCGRNGKTGPRAAEAQEIRAYAAWLASKAGLFPTDASEVVGGEKIWRSQFREPVKGVTYGERGDWNKDLGAYNYEPGAFSVPFPGRNAHRDKVTFEALGDDGEVIATSCLPVEPKKGGVVWDRDAVRKAAGKIAKPSRSKRKSPLSAEYDGKAEISAVETQEAVKGSVEPVAPVSCANGPEIAHDEPVSNPDELPEPGLADQVAALASMVAELRREVDGWRDDYVTAKMEARAYAQEIYVRADTPVVEMETPIMGIEERTKDEQIDNLRSQVAYQDSVIERLETTIKQTKTKRSPAHEMAIRAYLRVRRERERLRVQQHNAREAATAYMRNADILSDERFMAMRKRRRAVLLAWEHRRQARLQRAIAADHMRMREQVQEELRATDKRLSFYQDMANTALYERNELQRKRRRAVLFARDLQKRLSGEYRLIDKLQADKRVLRDEIASLKSRPVHMGQPVKPDDYQRLMRERDDARASLAARDEKCRQLTHALNRGSDLMEMMIERALRAETALKAIEARQSRARLPYRANVSAVRFGVAA